MKVFGKVILGVAVLGVFIWLTRPKAIYKDSSDIWNIT